MKVIVIVVALLAARIFLNAFRLFATMFYYRKFEKGEEKLTMYIPPVSRLFDKAGVSGKVSPLIDSEIPNDKLTVDKAFRFAAGMYLFRIRTTFYPSYWLAFPSKVFRSRSLRMPAWFQNIFSVLFWTITVICAYFINRCLDAFLPQAASLLGILP